MINIQILPKAITTPNGLRTKLEDIYRELPYNTKKEILFNYNHGIGEILDRNNNILAKYIQFSNDKYKLIINK